ncbi:hypothetical protein B296_00045524 [Ensete ventricosum]|uniref:Protein kinase domain-containing protein n=1 Tax=Ensete ventricosum TaxID=4639 RepID=A0A426Y1V7_ENSVE|nr:hypothetical protein B296_00045524 [Ensete ventricosum]
MTDEGREVMVGETGGKGEGELDHHVVGMTGEGTREDEVGDSRDDDPQEKEERPGDCCVPSVGLVDAHILKAGSKAPELVVSAGEAACIQHQLIFGATEYTASIDIWSVGCVLAELLLGQVLGTPTREEIRCMNPNYTEFRFPQIKAHPWHKLEACTHPFFDELREPNARLPNGRPLPPLFDFKQEVSKTASRYFLNGASPELIDKLIPEHLRRQSSLSFLRVPGT